jgi:hypothetical protein
MDKEKLFTMFLAKISGKIIERNQSENSAAYAATQEIDEQLDNLSKEMPPSVCIISCNL